MSKTTIVNVVATADLQQELDLNELGKLTEILHDVDIYGGRAAYFKASNMKGKVSIFCSGKMISVGTKSKEQAFFELEYVKQFLVERNFIEPTRLQPRIQNMIVTTHFGESLNLEELYKKFKVIYEPEQFPAGILRIKEPSEATLLIFSSGKAVITGLKDSSQIEPIIKHIVHVIEASR